MGRQSCGMTVFFFILIVAASAADVRAQTYRCRDAQGKIFFADAPERFPPGCRPLEPLREQKGRISIIPSPPTEPPETSEPAGVPEETKTDSDQENQAGEWEKEAEKLVRDYREGVVLRQKAYFIWEKREAFLKMKAARDRRNALAAEVAASRIPFRAKERIESILADIPAD